MTHVGAAGQADARRLSALLVTFATSPENLSTITPANGYWVS